MACAKWIGVPRPRLWLVWVCQGQCAEVSAETPVRTTYASVQPLCHGPNVELDRSRCPSALMRAIVPYGALQFRGQHGRLRCRENQQHELAGDVFEAHKHTVLVRHGEDLAQCCEFVFCSHQRLSHSVLRWSAHCKSSF